MRVEYQAVSLNKEFYAIIKKHIEKYPYYTNIAQFVRIAVINQLKDDERAEYNKPVIR